MDVFGKKTHPVLEYDKVPKLQRHSTPEFYGQFFFLQIWFFGSSWDKGQLFWKDLLVSWILPKKWKKKFDLQY